nr:type VI secretion system tip protein TssI/VgrG [uncultured Tolumonas sp.]
MSVLDSLSEAISNVGRSLFSANEPRFLLTLAGCNQVVQVLRFSGQEALNVPWELNITVVSDAENISPETMLGTSATLTLIGSAGKSYYHGQVWQFCRQTQGKRLTQYQLIVRPALSWLRLGRNQRIFQQKSATEIIKQLLQEQHIPTDQIVWKLSATYPARDYCVQYAESDLQFITRLLSEDGMHYYFAHTEKHSQLVFTDHPSGWSADLAAVIYKPSTGQAAEADTLYSFLMRRRIAPTMVDRRYFNLHKPLTLTNAQYSATPKIAKSLKNKEADKSSKQEPNELSHYHYCSGEQSQTTAQQTAQRHLEAVQAQTVTAEGKGNLSQLRVGYFLPVTGHACHAANSRWLLTDVTLTGEQPQVLEEVSNGQSRCHVHFSAVPCDIPWRPAIFPEKPRLHGIQTATVTGPAGEAIYTDALGRIKVQFHWDREGKHNEQTSCWVRVMHDWAGNGYGVVKLPRIGQEVQVSFEEGDPDKPLITGCLHNGEQVTTWDLPLHQTRSGIRTRSTPGGGGSNELRFEDKKGREQLRWLAEKDWDAKIRHSSHTQIDGSHHRAVGGNDYREIQGEQHQTFEANVASERQQNQHSTVDGSLEQAIAQNYLLQAGQDLHWQNKHQAIYHAGVELILQAGGSFIKLDPSGIILSGPLVTMNQGGSALAVESEAAELPHKPAGAHDAGSGNVPQAKAPEPVVKFEPKKINQVIYSD